MKEIKAIIRPPMPHKVMEALHALPHFSGVTVSDAQGQGRGRGTGGGFVPSEETIFFTKMIKLELFCADKACDELVAVIQQAAHTGNPGDGVVMVAELPRVVRIRSGDERNGAV